MTKTTKTKKTAARVSAKSILAALGNKPLATASLTVGTDENQVEVLLNTNLTLSDRRDLVNKIVAMVFVPDDKGNIQYCPYLKEFAFSCGVLAYLTNIQLPDTIDQIWAFCSTTGIVQKVIDALPPAFIRGLFQEVNELIEFKKAQLEKRGKLDDVVAAVLSLAKTLDEKLNSADGQELVEYLKGIVPELKDELGKGLQGEAAAETAE